MKTTIFAVAFALIGINAAVAADNNNSANIIPTPNQLVETELLPKFKAKVKMEARGGVGSVGRMMSGCREIVLIDPETQ